MSDTMLLGVLGMPRERQVHPVKQRHNAARLANAIMLAAKQQPSKQSSRGRQYKVLDSKSEAEIRRLYAAGVRNVNQLAREYSQPVKAIKALVCN